jgi:hypothetical protein
VRHRSASITRSNDAVLTEGVRMLSVQLATEDVAGNPDASRALFWL